MDFLINFVLALILTTFLVGKDFDISCIDFNPLQTQAILFVSWEETILIRNIAKRETIAALNNFFVFFILKHLLILLKVQKIYIFYCKP